MGKTIDMAGLRFGRLVVVSCAGSRHQQMQWLCRCDCGNESVCYGRNLRLGRTASCGCLAAEVASHGKRTHGMSNTREFKTWTGMLSRCNNPTDDKYHLYGARGITVCERWNSFENFYADMGNRPVSMTIDRIDVNGHYEPGNCRWATALQQQNNKRSNRPVTAFGKTLNLSQWARETGMPRPTIVSRLKAGWALERALSK